MPSYVNDFTQKAQNYFTANTAVQKQLTAIQGSLTSVNSSLNSPFIKWTPLNLFTGSALRVQAQNYTKQIANLTVQYRQNSSWYDIYTALPNAISARQGTAQAITSVDDAMKFLGIPEGLYDPSQLTSITAAVDSVLAAMIMPTPSTGGNEDITAGQPELVTPTNADATHIPMQSLHSISVAEIGKSIFTPQVAAAKPVLTTAQWNDVLQATGSTAPGVDLTAVELEKKQTEDYLKQWQDNRDNLNAAFNEAKTMPSWSIGQYLMAAIGSPGLVALDALNWWSLHVTAPMAEMVSTSPLMFTGTGQSNRDNMNTLYQQQLADGKDSWSARAAAWKIATDGQWQAAIAEAGLDPTNLLGVGAFKAGGEALIEGVRLLGAGEKTLATVSKVAKPLIAFDTTYGKVMNAPFDAMKAGWGKLPFTTAQRAARMAETGMQSVKVYAEEAVTAKTGYKSFLANMSTKDMAEVLGEAMDFANTKIAGLIQGGESKMADAGRALWTGGDISKSVAGTWALKLRGTAELPASSIMDMNNYFNAVLVGGMEKKEAATLILKTVGAVDDTGELLVKAESLISDRMAAIKNKVLADITSRTNGHAATKMLLDNMTKASKNRLDSVAFQTRLRQASVQRLLGNIGDDVKSVWSRSIDANINKPFASAYLAFAAYGPMNIAEDMLRSLLGGVSPRRIGYTAFESALHGLKHDLSITRTATETGGTIAHMNPGWVINAAASPLRLLGVKEPGKWVYNKMIYQEGVYQTALRQNFVVQKYVQNLKTMFGQTYHDIVESGPDKVGLSKELKKLEKQVIHEVQAAKISGMPNLVGQVKDKFTNYTITRKMFDDILSLSPDLSPAARQVLSDSFEKNRLMKNITGGITDAHGTILEDFIQQPKFALGKMQDSLKELTDLGVHNPTEVADAFINLTLLGDTANVLPGQVLGRLTNMTRGMGAEARGAYFTKVSNDLIEFMHQATQSIADHVKILQKSMESPELKFSEDFKNAVSLTFDSFVDRQTGLSDLRNSVEELRQRIFSETAPGDRDAEFWDNYSSEMNSLYTEHERLDASKMAAMTKALRLQSQIGSMIPQRAAVVVTDRPLATADVAKMLGIRGNELVNSMISTMSLQGKERFVTYVSEMAMESEKSTFTRDAVGSVYDSVLAELKGSSRRTASPAALDMLNKQEGELETVRQNIEKLKMSNPADQTVVDKIGKFIDAHAAALQAVTPSDRTASWTFNDVFTSKYKSELKSFVDDIDIELNLSSVKGVELFNGHSNFSPSKGIVSINDVSDKRILYHELGHAHQDYLLKTNPTKLYSMLEDWRQATFESFKRQKIGKAWEDNYPAIKTKADIESRLAGWDSSKWFYLENQKTIEGFMASFGSWASKTSDAHLVTPEEIKIFEKYFPKVSKTPKVNITEWQANRQTALDAAMKDFYREFTDYTNQNAIDSFMKSIFPFWGYESQRILWVPRTFMRHPATFTSFERYQQNSDNGYISVPGTDVQFNPFRGTVFGNYSTQLSRMAMPSKNQGPIANVLNGIDAISRYGFYPGAGPAFITTGLSGTLGLNLGEMMPSIVKTPMDALVALFPKSDAVKNLTEVIFNDRFKDYMTIQAVTKAGGDGVAIWQKQQDKIPLTQAEQDMWDNARRDTSTLDMIFQQIGVFRYRPEEQRAAAENAAVVIQQMTGYTPEQQDWLKTHGYDIWDMVGGMSPTNKQILQEMDYYKWVGLNRPAMPENQQIAAGKLDNFWSAVTAHSDANTVAKHDAERDFLSGRLSPSDYLSKISGIYTDNRNYIDTLKSTPAYADVPLTLDERTAYYQKSGVAMPVQHPFQELVNLYNSIELKNIIDPVTGERLQDWTNFFALRDAIAQAIPANMKDEWEAYINRNKTPLEQLRNDVTTKYLTIYDSLYDKVKQTFSADNQTIIDAYLMQVKTGRAVANPDLTAATIVNDFKAKVTSAKGALRTSNPYLDAWLFYWGRTTSFKTDAAKNAYLQICGQTGRQVA
jgi:hypothetical protein